MADNPEPEFYRVVVTFEYVVNGYTQEMDHYSLEFDDEDEADGIFDNLVDTLTTGPL